MIPDETVQRILAAAVLAPSGDNSQPWSFKIEDGTIFVLLHPQRDHPILNVEARGTYLSAGAVIENMVTAATHEGYRSEVQLFPNSGTAAAIRFSKDEVRGHPLFSAIEARHTNRGVYRNGLSKEMLDRLAGVTSEGVRLVFVSDSSVIQSLARAVSMMEEAALRTKELHKLFFESILWDKHENSAGEPGLYIKTTELPAPIQLLFRVIRFWPIMRVLNSIGFAKLAASSNAAIYASSGAIVGFLIEKTDPENYILAGRAFERLWLAVIKESLAAQPLAGLLYLSEYVRNKNVIHIEPALQERILAARTEIDTVFKSGSSTIAMLMRIGEPLAPASARSHRKAPVLQTV